MKMKMKEGYGIRGVSFLVFSDGGGLEVEALPPWLRTKRLND